MAEVFGVIDVSTEAAMNRGCCKEADLGVQVISSLPARIALQADKILSMSIELSSLICSNGSQLARQPVAVQHSNHCEAALHISTPRSDLCRLVPPSAYPKHSLVNGGV